MKKAWLVVLSMLLAASFSFGCASGNGGGNDGEGGNGGSGGGDGNGGGVPWPPPSQQEEVVWDNAWPADEAAADSSFTAPKLVWQDEFNGSELDTSKWAYARGNGNNGWGNNEKQYYRPENVRVNGGKLQIMARYESYGGCKYTSGKIWTQGVKTFLYGKIEARIKLPAGTGFWPAFWMMPEDSEYGVWPRSGEIDIMEAKGRVTDETSGAVHYGAPHQYKTNAHALSESTIMDWHVYSCEWKEGSIELFVDGDKFLTVKSGTFYTQDNGVKNPNANAPFDKPFHIILNLAVGGTFDGDRIPAPKDFGALMEVDYVRVYEL